MVYSRFYRGAEFGAMLRLLRVVRHHHHITADTDVSLKMRKKQIPWVYWSSEKKQGQCFMPCERYWDNGKFTVGASRKKRPPYKRRYKQIKFIEV